MKPTAITFRTIDEATEAASEVASACPDPTLAAIGINELLVNAVEHGNLELTYHDKSRLGGHNDWMDEIQRRLQDPRYADRIATVHVEVRSSEVVITVRDQGLGFDASAYVDFDRERLHHHHGRGIALARHLCFDDLDYQDAGRMAVAKIRLDGGSEPAPTPIEATPFPETADITATQEVIAQAG